MGKISRTQAFIDIAEAINNGCEKKANVMINIVGKSIAADNRKKEVSPTISLSKKEKIYFSR